jgi:eukaryotic-like serine/threonine-protein kinase
MSNHHEDDPEQPEDDATTHIFPTEDRHVLNEQSESAEAAQSSLKLPGFKVIRELGRGGMGQVFLARQIEPVERDVAIKLIQKRIRNALNEQRFQVERQALAEMHHPAIAQIFEAGTNPDGFPYFAMEYVPGQPLVIFANHERLDIKQRLELFIRICQGVSHAHQKGIIHRDLKPANILVSRVDDVPSPKIIDFGIAGAAESARDRRSQSTTGTPVYMAPELFDENASVDTRSDIYSLGVIFYELLTDHRPHRSSLFKNTDTAIILQNLVEKPALPPSRLLSTYQDSLGQIADLRQVTPRRLERKLTGDLDAIALKAINPDPDQRYASVSALAEDVRNHLERKPVLAMGQARGYRFRRFLARNAIAVSSLSLIMLALAIGLTAAVLGMMEAQRQQQIAEDRSLELEKMIAFQQSMLGDLEPRRLGEGFVERLRRQYAQSFDHRVDDQAREAGIEAFDVAVGQINPTDLAQDLIDEFMLRRAVTNIETDFADEPLLQADLYQSVRDVYVNAGMIELSLPLAGRIVDLRLAALGPSSARTLDARQVYFRLLSRAGQFETAGAELEQILTHMDRDDPEQLSLRHNAWDSRANLLINTGQHEPALEVAIENVERAERELGPHHEFTVLTLNTLGYVYARSGELELALKYFQESADRARGHFDPGESAYYSALLNVGAALSGLNRSEEALVAEQEVFEILSTKFGRRHMSTIRVMNNMVMTRMDLGQFEEAEALMLEILALGRETYGLHNPTTLHLQHSLGQLYVRTGEFDRALPELTEVIIWRERLLGEDHPETMRSRHVLARTHLGLGEIEQALDLAIKVHDQHLAHFGSDHHTVNGDRWLLIDIYQQIGNHAEEARWRDELLRSRIRGDRLAEASSLDNAIRLLEIRLEHEQTEQARELTEIIQQTLSQAGPEFEAQRQAFESLIAPQ